MTIGFTFVQVQIEQNGVHVEQLLVRRQKARQLTMVAFASAVKNPKHHSDVLSTVNNITIH
jgi:hypothetical protein